MSDNPWRREAKKFEPPPWEKEQFDQPSEAQKEQRVEQETTEQPKPAEVEAEEEEEVSAEKVIQKETSTPPLAEGQAGPSEAQMEAMLVSLKAEEPKGDRAFWKWGLVFSALMALTGSVVMIWGIVAFQATRGTGTAGVAGSSIMIIFGAAFIAIAGWAAYKILRQQGVL